MQPGFTFIEVLISLFILSLGLLGIAALEITALRSTQESYLQSIASIQLSSLFEQLYANPELAAVNAECSEWNQENQYFLPQGKGVCSCQSNSCDLTISWKNSQPRSLSLHVEL